MITTQDKISYILLGMLLAYSTVSLAISIYGITRYYARKKQFATLLGAIYPETAEKLKKKGKNARF